MLFSAASSARGGSSCLGTPQQVRPGNRTHRRKSSPLCQRYRRTTVAARSAKGVYQQHWHETRLDSSRELHDGQPEGGRRSRAIQGGGRNQHWISTTEGISWEKWECAEKSAVTVKLAPGEASEKTLPIVPCLAKPQNKLSFKMGFTPLGSKQTFWSNEVTLQVDEEKAAELPAELVAAWKKADARVGWMLADCRFAQSAIPLRCRGEEGRGASFPLCPARGQ